jgi:DNA-binding PadR family transcriptional regulator
MGIKTGDLELERLLFKWEGVYKRGLLSFWILLLLDEQPSYAYEMAGAIRRISQGTLTVDEKSLYRALSRFEKAGILRSERQKSEIGPARRYYFLSELGKELLIAFIQRNILVFQSPGVASRIEDLVDGRSGNEPIKSESAKASSPTNEAFGA